MTKPIDAIRNFAKAPNNQLFYKEWAQNLYIRPQSTLLHLVILVTRERAMGRSILGRDSVYLRRVFVFHIPPQKCADCTPN